MNSEKESESTPEQQEKVDSSIPDLVRPNDHKWPSPRSKAEELRQGFAKKIIGLLEEGKAPWQRPWTYPPCCMPVNAVSEKKYHGNNVLYLLTTSMYEGYADPRWVTYKQAQEQGWQVRKGEQGTKIEYWSEFDPTKTKKGEKELNERIRDMLDVGTSEEKIAKAREGYTAGFIKYYTVFNAAQIEGMPPQESEIEAKDFKPNDRAEKILDNCGVPIVYGSFGASYNPDKDQILMPNRKQFVDEDHFYATVLHEIAHSTGHPSRLNREEGMKSRFGSKGYAKEELRAEMASLFIHAGIGFVVTEEGMEGHTKNHAAYVKHWLEILKEDYKEFFRATRDANKIADYVLNYEKERAQARDGTEFEIIPNARGEAARAAPSVSEAEKSFIPQPGQRVTFQPHDGKVTLTGTVKEVNEHEVVLQCGRASIPTLREKGSFEEAPELDSTYTKEHAQKLAQDLVGEKGNVYVAKGEDAVYNGAIVELTPTYAIQKVGEDAILHRLKDLPDISLIQPGQDVTIAKMGKGEVTVEPRNGEQSREGISR